MIGVCVCVEGRSSAPTRLSSGAGNAGHLSAKDLYFTQVHHGKADQRNVAPDAATIAGFRLWIDAGLDQLVTLIT